MAPTSHRALSERTCRHPREIASAGLTTCHKGATQQDQVKSAIEGFTSAQSPAVRSHAAFKTINDMDKWATSPLTAQAFEAMILLEVAHYQKFSASRFSLDQVG